MRSAQRVHVWNMASSRKLATMLRTEIGRVMFVEGQRFHVHFLPPSEVCVPVFVHGDHLVSIADGDDL